MLDFQHNIQKHKLYQQEQNHKLYKQNNKLIFHLTKQVEHVDTRIGNNKKYNFHKLESILQIFKMSLKLLGKNKTTRDSIH